MLKRLLLAHIFLVTFAVPAVVYAVETELSPEKPDALIVEEGSLCNYSTFGIPADSSAVVLRARWIPKKWQPVPAGQYISTEMGDLKECPKDYYCPGLDSYTFNENDSDEKRGIFACADGFHTDSTKSTNQQDCYKSGMVACSVQNPYTTEHMVSVNYAEDEVYCTQRQGGDAVCDLSCDIVGVVCEAGYVARKADGVWTCTNDMIACEAGTYLSSATKKCEVCLENHFCAGGEYEPDESRDQGIVACQSGLKSPVGTSSENDCGIILRIGGDALYMHADRRETDHPAFVLQDKNGKKWYAQMEAVGEKRENVKPVNDFEATKQLHVMTKDGEYTVRTSRYEKEK